MIAKLVDAQDDAATSPIGEAVAALRQARQDWRARGSSRAAGRRRAARGAIETAVELLSAALYPRRLGQFRGNEGEEDRFVAATRLTAATMLERFDERSGIR